MIYSSDDCLEKEGTKGTKGTLGRVAGICEDGGGGGGGGGGSKPDTAMPVPTLCDLLMRLLMLCTSDIFFGDSAGFACAGSFLADFSFLKRSAAPVQSFLCNASIVALACFSASSLSSTFCLSFSTRPDYLPRTP